MPWTTDSDDDSATRDQLNADLAVTYGTHFLDVIGPLQAANDGSADDLSDVANGWTPRSLRFDHGHLNDAGYGVVAQLLHGAIVALRW
jgi:lysophospholipase L1-like esterase